MPPLQGIDKRNQNIIRSVLESPPPANVSHAEEKVGRKGVDGSSKIVVQARTFYQSCVRERETTAPADLFNLQKVLEFAGGWQLSGTQNESMLLSERMFRLQNQLGLSLSPPHSHLSISSRCVCPLHLGGDCRERDDPHRGCARRLDRGPVGGPHHLPQGFSSQPTSPNSHFLFQLMAGISWLLAEASKCPGVDYMYDGELAKSEEGNDTLEVMEYEYDYDVESPR